MAQIRREAITDIGDSLKGSIFDNITSKTQVPTAKDGINIYGNTRVNPSTQVGKGVSLDGSDTRIQLTSRDFDVCEFSNSYLHLKVNLDIQISSSVDLLNYITDNTIAASQCIFVGLKGSNQIIDMYNLEFNNVPIDSTKQNEGVIEGYMLHCQKAKCQLENKNHSVSTWKEVNEMDNSMCGVYIPISEIVLTTSGTSKTISKTLNLIIPFRDIYALQAFDEYPNGIFGLLGLVARFTTKGFVWAEVNPVFSASKYARERNISDVNDEPLKSVVGSFNPEGLAYERCFHQVGTSGTVQFVEGAGPSKTDANATFTVSITGSELTECWADIRGYRMSEECKKLLIDYFSNPENPFVIPSQKIYKRQFQNSGGTSGNVDTTLNARFPYITDLAILHPVASNIYTCYQNITAENYKLRVGRHEFPHQNNMKTWGPEFYQTMIMNTDFDDIWVCPDAYEWSITDAMCNKTEENDNGTPNQTIYAPVDNTDFVPIFQCQRDNGGVATWFDGINSLYETAELKYNLYGMAYTPYGKAVSAGAAPSPYLIMNSQTFWLFRLVDGEANCQYLTDGDFKKGYENPALNNAQL